MDNVFNNIFNAINDNDVTKSTALIKKYRNNLNNRSQCGASLLFAFFGNNIDDRSITILECMLKCGFTQIFGLNDRGAHPLHYWDWNEYDKYKSKFLTILFRDQYTYNLDLIVDFYQKIITQNYEYVKSIPDHCIKYYPIDIKILYADYTNNFEYIIIYGKKFDIENYYVIIKNPQLIINRFKYVPRYINLIKDVNKFLINILHKYHIKYAVQIFRLIDSRRNVNINIYKLYINRLSKNIKK